MCISLADGGWQMQTFTSEELQRRPADVQQSALVEPTYVTFHGRPRLVVMSVDEFDRLQGRRRAVFDASEISEEVLDDLRAMANAYPVHEEDLGLVGGLVDDEHPEGTLGSGMP
jgi:prevent-host-death family protein